MLSRRIYPGERAERPNQREAPVGLAPPALSGKDWDQTVPNEHSLMKICNILVWLIFR